MRRYGVEFSRNRRQNLKNRVICNLPAQIIHVVAETPDFECDFIGNGHGHLFISVCLCGWLITDARVNQGIRIAALLKLRKMTRLFERRLSRLKVGVLKNKHDGNSSRISTPDLEAIDAVQYRIEFFKQTHACK